MITYAKKEQAKYWPVSAELMAQYKDGSHTKRDRYGDLYWWQNDKLHRDGDKPAVIDADGHLVWFQNGQLHREGDKPAKIFADGRLEWWQNDQLHRIGGPAIIRSNGTCRWYWQDEELPVNSQDDFVKYLTKHNLIKDEDMNPKTITASEALAIYEEAVKKKKLKLWETYAPKLDKIIREQAENALTVVILDYKTWNPMVDFIKDLGYTVCHSEPDDCLEIDWSKRFPSERD